MSESERSKKGTKAKRSLDALPRPSSAPPSWDDLPGIRKRQSLAPPAPPPSHAPPSPTTHELFDVDSAEVEHARAAVARRAAERASARPHPPKRNDAAKPNDGPVQRLSTPLSWEAAMTPTAGEVVRAGLADAVDEEISDEFLEPIADSVPLVLPPISSSEPLASVIPTGALVAPPAPAAPKKRTRVVSAVALAAVAVLAVGWFVTRSDAPPSAPAAAAVEARGESPPPLAAPAIEANPALRVPLPPLELDIGVPDSAPAPSAEPSVPDPATVPPVAPSGVLPTRPLKVEDPPFDGEAATAALSQAANAALTCRKDGDPAGAATVIVRFAPSGRVTSAVVESGPFAGTVTGGCVATTFRRARVPAFTGDYVSVKKTISLR